MYLNYYGSDLIIQYTDSRPFHDPLNFTSGAGPSHSPCPGPVSICLNEIDVIIASIHILCFTGDDISPIRCPTDGMSICGPLTTKGLDPDFATFTICPEEVNPALAHPADEPRIANHNVAAIARLLY